jgi:hypothetical protein
MRCRTDDTTSTSRGLVVGIETLTVAGRPVETIHLRLASTLVGAARGTRTADAWLLRSNGLLVRTVSEARMRARSIIGVVAYHERYRLALHSLDPRL